MSQHGRRQFLAAAGALLTSPVALSQQPRRNYVVGTLLGGALEDRDLYRSALRERLSTHGFVEGRNLRIEERYPDLSIGQAAIAARELVALNPDAIFSCFTTVTEGALQATKSVPIIFTWVSDPVVSGIVASLARPGGNATGVTSRLAELNQKRFGLALDLVLGAKRVAHIGAGTYPLYEKVIRPSLKKAASQAKVELIEVPLFGTVGLNLPGGVDDAHKAGAQVALMPWHLISTGNRSTLEGTIRRSIELRLPLINCGVEEVEAGGLVSYGTNIVEDLRLGADLLARVLKGEKPANLPVNQASRFEMAVNLRTARSLGLTIPPSILLRADRVIE